MKLFIAIALYITSACGIKYELCNMTKINCVSKYDSKVYEETCQFSACKAPYTLQCGSNKCAQSKSDCKSYKEALQIIRKLQNLDRLRFFNYESTQKRKKIIENLISSESEIKSCQPELWKVESVCLKPRHCFSRVMKNETISKLGFIRTDCPCDGNNPFFCKTDFCALDKTVCSAFKSRYKIISRAYSTAIGIKNCRNRLILAN